MRILCPGVGILISLESMEAVQFPSVFTETHTGQPAMLSLADRREHVNLLPFMSMANASLVRKLTCLFSNRTTSTEQECVAGSSEVSRLQLSEILKCEQL